MDKGRFTSPFAVMLIVVCVATIWSGWKPADRWVWVFELALGWIAVATLLIWRRTLPFTGLSYLLMAALFLVLALGAKYTYAHMPLFDWLKEAFSLQRNHFDRLGHFMQGFVPAMIARELLLRRTPLRPGKMLFFLCTCICLSFSAFYELLEWQLAANFYADDPAGWLGMQGDQWDAQCDMSMALLGAISSQILFARVQDRALELERKNIS